MAYTTINKSGDYFNTKLYTGNESTRSETGVGFQPDFTWIKVRSRADPHILTDAVRGDTSSQLIIRYYWSTGTNFFKHDYFI